MGDVNLEIKLTNLDERVIKIEESGGGSGGDGYITSVSTDFNVVNKKLSLSNDVTTKLSKLDTTDDLSVELAKKIDKPASATDGQVLTYNGTSEKWEAKDSQGGSITEPTELEKGIIGGDTYVIGKTYSENETCIYNNKIYVCKATTTSLPTDTTYWEEISISTLYSNLTSLTYNEEWELIATFSSSKSITLSKPITDFKKLAICCIYANSIQGTTIAPIELVKSIGQIAVRMGATEILGNVTFTDDINVVAYYEKSTSLNGYFNLYGIK